MHENRQTRSSHNQPGKVWPDSWLTQEMKTSSAKGHRAWPVARNFFVSRPAVFGTLSPMELKERAPGQTLARRLGETAHVSGLAIRLARLRGLEIACPNAQAP